MSVATGCGCKEVYRFPLTTYPYSSFFLQQHPYFLFILLNVFHSYIYIYGRRRTLVRSHWIKKKTLKNFFFTVTGVIFTLHRRAPIRPMALTIRLWGWGYRQRAT